MRERAKFLPPPSTSIEGLTNLRPQGGASKGSKLAPLLILTRFRDHKQLTKNKGQRVTPFWHNDTPARVTVTFGRRRVGSRLRAKNLIEPQRVYFRVFRRFYG